MILDDRKEISSAELAEQIKRTKSLLSMPRQTPTQDTQR